MPLTTEHDTIEEIPEAHRELFSEQGGKFVLTGITGVKTQEDINRLQTALTKERDDHKATKASLGTWGELKHDEVVKQLDRVAELEAAAGDKIDDVKLDEMAATRARTIVAPFERENKKLNDANAQLTSQIQGFQTQIDRRTITDSVSKALDGAKVTDPGSREDAVMLAGAMFEITEDRKVLTKDGVGVTPGVDAKLWLDEMQPKRPNWFGPTQGAGAKGSTGTTTHANNPWSEGNWNMTKQAEVYRTIGADKAKLMAEAAGSKVGASAPTKKK